MSIKTIGVRYQSIWDGGIEIETYAILSLETGEVYDIESSEVEGLDICDSESVIIKNDEGSTTFVFDVEPSDDGDYFIEEEGLATARALYGYKGAEDE